jgi:hypothetical protein
MARKYSCGMCMDRGKYGRRSRGYKSGWRWEICSCAAGAKFYPPATLKINQERRR